MKNSGFSKKNQTQGTLLPANLSIRVMTLQNMMFSEDLHKSIQHRRDKIHYLGICKPASKGRREIPTNSIQISHCCAEIWRVQEKKV